MPPLVTTIIPVFNRAAMLREAVASVLAQTYRPVEIVIVDDGSTDDTPHVAETLASQHPEVRAIHQANGGVGRSREAGRLVARGGFIQHLDSDDLLLPEKFALQVAALEAGPQCGAAYGWTRLRHPDGRVEPRPWKRSGERIEAMFPAMLQSRWWDTPSPLYRRAVIDAAGAWLPLRIEEDWEYDARIASAGVALAFVEEWVCEVRIHNEGHLAGGGQDQARLRDRAVAHEHILSHALNARIGENAPGDEALRPRAVSPGPSMRSGGTERGIRAPDLRGSPRVACARSPHLRRHRPTRRLAGGSRIAALSDRLRW